MKSIREYFIGNKNKEIVLPQDEYKGPLVIDKPCVVDGANSTLWATKGPVLIIDAPNVVVRNLNVELIEKNKFGLEKAAIQTNFPNARLSNVSVIGEVKGFTSDPDWNLPEKFDLGEFKADEVNEFSFTVKTVAKVSVVTKLEGVKVSPQTLNAGENVLKLQVAERKDGEFVFGDILLKSGGLARKIAVTGHARADAPLNGAKTAARTVASMPAAPAKAVAPTAPKTGALVELSRGQRMPLAGLDISALTVTYADSGRPLGVDADVVAALLQGNGRVKFEKDFVFFNNVSSSDKSVSFDGKNKVFIDLKKAKPHVEKIAVACSLSGGALPKKRCFGEVRSPMVTLKDSKGNGYTYKIDGLKEEKSVVFLEIYRYKSEWKVSVVGMGYSREIDFLCELYGVNFM